MGLSMKAPWRSNVHRYRSLEDLYMEKQSIAWYWQLIAQIASWMVLGGFLILPSTFDSDPKLRFSHGVLAIIIVALLTGGYSLTALLWFACPSLLFRLDHIFMPLFSISTFGFLAVVYGFATSPRYTFSQASAPITLALALSSAIGYGLLALMAHAKLNKINRQQNDAAFYHRSVSGTPTTSTWQDPLYYQNWIANMYPSARSPGSFDGGSTMTMPPPTDDELVNQQMARLLAKHDSGPSPEATQTTFRLEWPTGADTEEEFDQFGRRRMRTFSGSNGGLLVPGTARGHRSRSESAKDGRNTPWAKLGRVVGTDRGRAESKGGTPGHQRNMSREERRREIELSNL